ncbi:hypothetical protein Hypma_008193 [Hypsizygus marmoreus]|uniref:Uncharacterized protein n=1 Tax=Hypsizygus marmoreus TaxID=39966 RepID=A0A369JQN5_HYPMA|nr:hypothetical protein Hypma_008193 [Hypsizygus marmoreus]
MEDEMFDFSAYDYDNSGYDFPTEHGLARSDTPVLSRSSYTSPNIEDLLVTPNDSPSIDIENWDKDMPVFDSSHLHTEVNSIHHDVSFLYTQTPPVTLGLSGMHSEFTDLNGVLVAERGTSLHQASLVADPDQFHHRLFPTKRRHSSAPPDTDSRPSKRRRADEGSNEMEAETTNSTSPVIDVEMDNLTTSPTALTSVQTETVIPRDYAAPSRESQSEIGDIESDMGLQNRSSEEDGSSTIDTLTSSRDDTPPADLFGEKPSDGTSTTGPPGPSNKGKAKEGATTISNTATLSHSNKRTPPLSMTQCLTASNALDHAWKNEHAVRTALLNTYYTGPYRLQAGFNEDRLHLGQRVEEIYLMLDPEIESQPDSEISISTWENGLPDVLQADLEYIFAPFPAIVCTPKETILIPADISARSPVQGQLWDSFSKSGIGNKISDLSNAPVPPSANAGRAFAPAGGNSNGKQPNDAGRGGEGGSGNGRNSGDRGDDGRGTGGSGGGGGGGGGGSNGGDGGDDGGGDDRIPFTSILSSREDASQPLPTRFTTASCIDISIDENRFANSFPPDIKCPSPWFSVDMTMLDITTDGGFHSPFRYSLGLSQIRMTASLCPTSVLQYSPNITHAEDDTVQVKAENNKTGGAWATLGAKPSVRIGGTMSHTSGTEITQHRWEIMTHRVNLEKSGNRSTEREHKKGILWKYAHNDKSFGREVGHSFGSKPSAIFGYTPTPHRPMPVLEVEVVTLWSSSGSHSSSARSFFPFRRPGKHAGDAPPAFTNFLHHVSMVVDLREVDYGSSWVFDVDTLDEETHAGLAKAGGALHFEPMMRTAHKAAYDSSYGMVQANCEILIRRAVEGRIAALTDVERIGDALFLSLDQHQHQLNLLSGAQSLLPSTSFDSSQNGSTMLPTPLPSPPDA